MKDHSLYKKLKQIALEGGYTIKQVKGLRFGQAVELLETREFTVTFLNNMKRGIVDAIRERDDKTWMEELKATAKVWLDLNFPSWEAEKGREGGKPYVTIWLEGKSGE